MTRREQAIDKYKKLGEELERSISRRRIDTILHELGRLEIVYGITTEEIHGKWSFGDPELDKAIRLSEETRRKNELEKDERR